MQKRIRIIFFLMALLIMMSFGYTTNAEEAVSGNNGWNVVNYTAIVDAYAPVVSLPDLKLQSADMDGIVLFDNIGKQVIADFQFQDQNIQMQLKSELQLYSKYILKVFLKNGLRYRINFTTGGLPQLKDTGERQIIKIPAMPSKGFNWPYLLIIPDNTYKSSNQGHKRYLMVDTTNVGVSKNFESCLRDVSEKAKSYGLYAEGQAEMLWTPMIMPVFPRPDITYSYQNESNTFYTHALDRDTATLHLKMKIPQLAGILTKLFTKAGYDIKDFYYLDRQLSAMMDHAIAYLNSNGFQVENNKVFLSGYSASGTFTDRFADLHPDKVKAVASGATLDDMMLPLANYSGEKLIFPLGTSDYKDITGNQFDLKKHNQVARLIYMGENDDNNTVPYPDCYGDSERNIIKKLWGLEVLPRAKQLISLYGKSGGKGMFILDSGIQHSASAKMNDYVMAFLKANRDSDTPVYPIPGDSKQLKYTLYK